MKSVDFYFDVGSPTAFLAYQRFLQLQQQYDFELNYKPVLLGGIFKASNNQSPVANPAKGGYMLIHDLPRFAQRYGVDLKFNPHFPINTLQLMRGAHAAIKLGCFDNYLAAIMAGVWQQELNLGDLDVVQQTLQSAGLDAEQLLSLSQEQEVKDALIAVTDEAVKRGAFGAPTMFIGDEMFFGQDRMDFIEERLQA